MFRNRNKNSDKISLRNVRSAFTLIELILGLIIVSVLGVSVFTAFFTAIKMQTKTENLGRFYGEGRFAINRMADEIENMIFYTPKDPKQNFLSSTDDHLTLLENGADGLKVIRYYIGQPDYGKIVKTTMGQVFSSMPQSIVVQSSEGQKAYALIREETPLVDYWQNQPHENAKTQIVTNQIASQDSLRFSYAYSPPKESKKKGYEWKDSWDKDALPAGVRIQLECAQPNQGGSSLVLTKEVYWPTVDDASP